MDNFGEALEKKVKKRNKYQMKVKKYKRLSIVLFIVGVVLGLAIGFWVGLFFKANAYYNQINLTEAIVDEIHNRYGLEIADIIIEQAQIQVKTKKIIPDVDKNK